MPDFALSITICSWNTLEDLRICLRSLEERLPEYPFEVVVIDNNSGDGSPDMVEAEFPWVRLFRLAKNLGFTGGHNYAMQQVTGDHVLLLNSDTIVHENAFKILMQFSVDHPEAGIIGPKLLNVDGSLQPSCRRFPNPTAAAFRNTFLGKLFPNNGFTRKYLMEDWNHDSVREVDWVSGAALLITKDALAKIGPMDEEYFMFCEDVDWCWRCWEAGYKVMYVPDSFITHAVGRSTDKAPNRMIGRFHSSMFRFYRKNMVPKMAWPLRPLALGFAATMLGLRAGIFIAKNRVDNWKRSKAK